MRHKEFPKDAKCPLCGGRIAPGSTTFTADIDKAVLIVREVPAQICVQCGEEWFTSEVSQQLDRLVEDMRVKGSEVEILNYQAMESRAVNV